MPRFNPLAYRRKIAKMKLSREELLNVLVREAELRDEAEKAVTILQDLRVDELVERVMCRLLGKPFLRRIK